MGYNNAQPFISWRSMSLYEISEAALHIFDYMTTKLNNCTSYIKSVILIYYFFSPNDSVQICNQCKDLSQSPILFYNCSLFGV